MRKFIAGLALLVYTTSTFAALGDLSLARRNLDKPTGVFSLQNYVINPDAESGNVANITGGSPAVNTSSPIDGARDFSITLANDTSSTALWSTNTVDNGIVSNNCEARVRYTASSIGSAVKFVVQVSGTTVASSNNLVTATIGQPVSVNYPCSASTTTIGFANQAGNSGSSAIKADLLYWGPATNVGQSPIEQNYVPYTSTIAGLGAGSSTNTFLWQRIADSMWLKFSIVKDATPGSGAADVTATIPTPYVIDTTKLQGNSNTLGVVTSYSVATASQFVTIPVEANSTTGIKFLKSGAAVTVSGADMRASSYIEGVVGPIPIVGWSASGVSVSQNQQLLPTVQKFTSGSGTYTTPAGVVYIKVRMVGGGGGGGGSGTTSTGGAGTAGGNTTFGSSLLTANGGNAGVSIFNGGPGTGGSATLNSPAIGTAITGTPGFQSAQDAAATWLSGGSGGSAPTFGGGAYGGINGGGTAGVTNSGAGGGGAGTSSSVAGYAGTGGGSGAFIEAIINNPSASYSYAVGGSGGGGSAGTSGFAGGAGAAGYIEVTEYYSSPSPLLVGSVTSANSGLLRIESAVLSTGSSPAITGQSSTWVASGTGSTGSTVWTLTSGYFSSNPTCFCNDSTSGGLTIQRVCTAFATSSTSVTTYHYVMTSGSATLAGDGNNINLLCIGPR